MNTHTVKIHFDDEQKAKDFLTWLCESGEQAYFEQEEYGNIKVAKSIEYFSPLDTNFPANDARRFVNAKFGGEDGLTAIAK